MSPSLESSRDLNSLRSGCDEIATNIAACDFIDKPGFPHYQPWFASLSSMVCIAIIHGLHQAIEPFCLEAADPANMFHFSEEECKLYVAVSEWAVHQAAAKHPYSFLHQSLEQ